MLFGAMVFVLWLGAQAVIAGNMSMGELSQFILFALLVAGSAAVAAMWGIGGIVGPPVTGWIFNLAGHETLPYVLAAPYVAFAVFLVVSGGHLVRRNWRGKP